MRTEIRTAIQYLSDYFKLSESNAGEECVKEFQLVLEMLLHNRYEGHWYLNNPLRGSAYRCVRMNTRVVDPLVRAAAIQSGLAQYCPTSLFKQELTIWIDPGSISYRIGETYGCVFTKRVF